MTDEAQDSYKVWAVDNMVYGPVDHSTLLQWIGENRVLPESWVHSQAENKWIQAKELRSIRKQLFPGQDTAFVELASQRGASVEPVELRQFSIFSGLSNAQLEALSHFGQLQEVDAGVMLIRKGDPADALYFLLSGEVRARIMVGLEDTTLGKIPAGDFFGEVAMFTQGSRSADVVTETPSRLFRLSSQAFQLLIREEAGIAAVILFALCRTMANRISQDNQRLQREVASTFLWR